MVYLSSSDGRSVIVSRSFYLWSNLSAAQSHLSKSLQIRILVNIIIEHEIPMNDNINVKNYIEVLKL